MSPLKVQKFSESMANIESATTVPMLVGILQFSEVPRTLETSQYTATPFLLFLNPKSLNHS